MTRSSLRIGFLALALLSVSVPTLAFAEGEGEHGAPLSFSRILTGNVGDDASDEAKAEAHGETMQFWWSVVNFTLLVLLLRKLGKKPLSEFLASRKAEIEKGIAEAAAMKQKAEAVAAEYSERMKTLDQELATLRTDIAKAAEADKARIVAEAEESARRLRAETESMIARQVQQLESQIRHEVVNAALSAAEKAVREATGPDDQRRLAEAFARELGTTQSGDKSRPSDKTEKRA